MVCGYKAATNSYSYKDKVIQRLKEYGRYIGVMFQLMDDLIDHKSTASDAQKDVKIDVQKCRPSCVLTIGYVETLNIIRMMNDHCIDILSSKDIYLSDQDAIKIYDIVQGSILQKIEEIMLT